MVGQKKVRVDKKGKAAETLFRCLLRWEHASLIQARPLTGRTHQIRVHLTYLGFPIAGDKKYGDRVFNRRMELLGLKRLILHAQSLEFCDPSGKLWKFRCDFPSEELKKLQALRQEGGSETANF